MYNSDYNKKYPKRKDTLLISDCMARKNISENSYNECVKEINDKKRISNKLSLILKINNNEDLKNYVGTYINRSLDSTIINNFFKHTDGELYSLKQFPIGTWDVTNITDMSSLFENGRKYIDIFNGKEYKLNSTTFNSNINTKIYNRCLKMQYLLIISQKE